MSLGSAVGVAAMCLLACGATSSMEDDDEPVVIDASTPPDPETSRFLYYIRSNPFPALRFEVDAVPGLGPAEGAGSAVIDALNTVLDKPDGISLEPDGELTSLGADHVWTFAELDALAQQSFGDRQDQGSIAIHMLYVDGHYEGDSDTGTVLGVAWSHRHITMFRDSIDRACSSNPLAALDPGACARAEAAIWLHEVGHVLGLVDNGLPMVEDHKDTDPAHGSHDVNSDCVMYWAYDGEAALDAVLSGAFGQGSTLAYCQPSIDDLNAVR